MKKQVGIFIVIFALMLLGVPAKAGFDTSAPAAVLMERSTGEILYEKNAHERLAPASVTKIMTLLLVFEAMDRGDFSRTDEVCVSATAAEMGGSQIYLEAGEVMTVEDLVKSVMIASANDAAVALAELVAGSEDAFVEKMNERAVKLDMTDTNFVNCTGLDADGHLSSAADIAKMSRELMKHSIVRAYSLVWMDSVRDGEFTLVNTNKLLKSYRGITGLKTGYTTEAKYCFSGTAERDGMELIAAVMGAESSDERFASAASMLDYGFAGWSLYSAELPVNSVPVILGKSDAVPLRLGENGDLVVPRSSANTIETELSLVESVEAPVTGGCVLGKLTVRNADQVIAEIPIEAVRDVERLGWFDLFETLFAEFVAG